MPSINDNADYQEVLFPSKKESAKEKTYLKDLNPEIDPREFKKKSITKILTRYTTKELMGIVSTIPGGMSMSLSGVIDKLTDGRFDPKKESGEARQVHMQMNGDLWKPFIECQKMLRLKDFSEDKVKDYDILYSPWDLRKPAVRKLSKIRLLIERYGEDDPDLTDALQDLDWLYLEKK